MAVEQKTNPHYNAEERQIDEHEGDHALSASGVRQQVVAKPVSSAVVAIGVGIGAGLLLSTLFSSERSRRERLSRRVGSYFPSGQSLRSSIEKILPDVISDRYLS